MTKTVLFLQKARLFFYMYIYNKRKKKHRFDTKYEEIMNVLKTNGKSSFFWKKPIDN